MYRRKTILQTPHKHVQSKISSLFWNLRFTRRAGKLKTRNNWSENKGKIERNRLFTLPEDDFEGSLLASKKWRQRTIECNLNDVRSNLSQNLWNICYEEFLSIDPCWRMEKCWEKRNKQNERRSFTSFSHFSSYIFYLKFEIQNISLNVEGYGILFIWVYPTFSLKYYSLDFSALFTNVGI